MVFGTKSSASQNVGLEDSKSQADPTKPAAISDGL